MPKSTKHKQHHGGYLQQCERDVMILKQKKERLIREFEDTTACENLFAMWSGLGVNNENETICHLKFSPMLKGHENEEFTIGFLQVGKNWTVLYVRLPYCISYISERFSGIKSIDDFCSLVRILQHEVYLYSLRKQQFQEAQSLSNKRLAVYPSLNTKVASLHFEVQDMAKKSDLSQVSVMLHYSSEKYLPVKLNFSFTGGDYESHQEFKRQLECLHHLPLKEALVTAFGLKV